jgi:hypothetical protein
LNKKTDKSELTELNFTFFNQGAMEYYDRRNHLGNEVRPGVSYAAATLSDSDVDQRSATDAAVVPEERNAVAQVNK